MSNFQALEVVDRGSETQPQVVENLQPQVKCGRKCFVFAGIYYIIGIIIMLSKMLRCVQYLLFVMFRLQAQQTG